MPISYGPSEPLMVLAQPPHPQQGAKIPAIVQKEHALKKEAKDVHFDKVWMEWSEKTRELAQVLADDLGGTVDHHQQHLMIRGPHNTMKHSKASASSACLTD
ncbi:hypothetical protein BU17DRAFT_100792 [Hysterangium stoloniferum]|nr:hypothetical protein BU17DRAFT_100792 [Hysterangium stoloniferum]